MPVYCLLDSKRDAVKIGYSKDDETLQKRIKTLQTASPFRLKTVSVKTDWGMKEERNIHKQLDKYSTDGGREWFDYGSCKWLIDDIFGEIELQSSASDDCEEECFITGLSVQNALDLIGWEDIPKLYKEDYETKNSGLLGYLENTHWEGASAISAVDLQREFLRDNVDFGPQQYCVEAVSRIISFGICQDVFSDECEIHTSVVSNSNGLILCLIEGEIPALMAEAESIYQRLFWPVDYYGNQLFVAVIDSSRRYQFVPYSFGKVW